MGTKLDEIDYELIRLLLTDSRQGYRDIRDQLGVSIGTIHNRIQKLKRKKIILNFSLNLDYEKIDLNKLLKLNEGCQKCIHKSVCELYNNLSRKENLNWNFMLKKFFGIIPEELSQYCLKYKEKEDNDDE